MFNFIGPVADLVNTILKKTPLTAKEKRERDRYKAEKNWKDFVKRIKRRSRRKPK
jgi:hypothetical protein